MASTSTVDPAKATSIYDFTVKDTFGEDVSLEKYRGQVVLIVNIASQCGLTKANYAQLTELKEKYSERGERGWFIHFDEFSSRNNVNFLYELRFLRFLRILMNEDQVISFSKWEN